MQNATLRALCTAARSNPTNVPMTAITSSSSTSGKTRLEETGRIFQFPVA